NSIVGLSGVAVGAFDAVRSRPPDARHHDIAPDQCGSYALPHSREILPGRLGARSAKTRKQQTRQACHGLSTVIADRPATLLQQLIGDTRASCKECAIYRRDVESRSRSVPATPPVG